MMAVMVCSWSRIGAGLEPDWKPESSNSIETSGSVGLFREIFINFTKILDEYRSNLLIIEFNPLLYQSDNHLTTSITFAFYAI